MLTCPANLATGFFLKPLAACSASSVRTPPLLPGQPGKVTTARSDNTSKFSEVAAARRTVQSIIRSPVSACPVKVARAGMEQFHPGLDRNRQWRIG